MRWWRSTSTRLIISHILVATFALIGAVFLDLIQWLPDLNDTVNRSVATLPGYEWLTGQTVVLERSAGLVNWQGLVVSPTGEVLYANGETNCQPGLELHTCAPEWTDLPEALERFHQDGAWWRRAVIDTPTEERILSQFVEVEVSPSFRLPVLQSQGVVDFIVISSGVAGCLALPLSALIAAIFVRWQTRRINRLTWVSQKFAQGNFNIRVDDTLDDDLGRVSQQFDSMADAIARNIEELRGLAQQNAELRDAAEQSAVDAERMRLSRELHDTIAQQLYQFSVRTSALPKLIDTNLDAAAAEADALILQSEAALLNLRTALVRLRVQGEQR